MSAICTFFGHRDAPESIFSTLQQYIEFLITNYQVTKFYFGGYGQFDRMALHAVTKLKSIYPEISCYFIFAYLDRPPENPKAYEELIYPENLEYVPKKFAISHRNQWMVNSSDFVICYVKHHYGGAFSAVSYAQKKNKSVLFL